jgi:hypothetical protein
MLRACAALPGTAIVLAMEKGTTELSPSFDDSSRSARGASNAARFERPSIEEISLCCEISAYAPDGDDRPLF